MKKHIFYFIAAVAVISMMVVACEKDIVEPTQSTTTDTTPSTPDLPDTPDTNSAPDTTLPAPMLPDFVGLDEWLVNSTWVAQCEYEKFVDESFSWRRFRSEYDPSRFGGGVPAGIAPDTFYFNADFSFRIVGRDSINGIYDLSPDSVGTMNGARMLYQISADSMVVWNWTYYYTADIRSWLFTKVQ